MIEYPYSDFHELNLDWALKTVKQAEEQSQEAIDRSEETVEYVDHYFDTLDLTEEVDGAMDRLVSAGVITQLLNEIVSPYVVPVIVSSVNDMTDQNKVYVLSSTQHVYMYTEGAFRDTGVIWGQSIENAFQAYRWLSSGADLDTISTTGSYLLWNAYDFVNTPNQTRGNRLLLSFANDGRYQIFLNLTTSELYARYFYNNTWSAWTLLADFPHTITRRTIENNQDFNDVRAPGYYVLTNAMAYPNAPTTSGRRVMLVYPWSTGNLYQVIFDYTAGKVFLRAFYNNAWQGWKTLTDGYASEHLYDRLISPAGPRVVYTKGACWVQPWDTSPAFHAAGQDPDCWGISADIQRTSDGYWVVYHDSNLSTGTTGSGVISDKTWAELQTLDIVHGLWNYETGAWNASQTWTGVKIPKFSNFLDICRRYGKYAIIEFKDGSGAHTITEAELDEIMSYVKARKMERSVIFTVNLASLQLIRSKYPEVWIEIENGVDISVDKLLRAKNLNAIFDARDEIDYAGVQTVHNYGLICSLYNNNTRTALLTDLTKNADIVYGRAPVTL